jgi:hypothetical protein
LSSPASAKRGPTSSTISVSNDAKRFIFIRDHGNPVLAAAARGFETFALVGIRKTEETWSLRPIQRSNSLESIRMKHRFDEANPSGIRVALRRWQWSLEMDWLNWGY